MENIWLRFQAPKCVKHIQKQCNSRYITINNTPAKTSRRTGNRARENRVLQKKMVLPQRGNHCCHLKSGKFGRPNLGVFWANGVFATVKGYFLVYFDWTSAGIFFTLSFAASVQFSQAASCTC